MAENQTADVVQEGQEGQGEGAEGQEQGEQAFAYAVTVEDAGPGSKKVRVEIPQDRIEQKLKEQFKELRQQAAIPGFRVGHAPQKLIEKRFASDVRDQVRGTLVRESYEQAIEKNKLQVIGEPDFENPDNIKLPEQGPLTYSFQVEVQPEFTLPDPSGLKVKRPKITIKDENIDQAMNNLREQQGALVPVEDRGVEAKDYLTANVHVKVGGEVVSHHHDAQLVARPGRIAGIEIVDLDQQLSGLKPGETRTVKAHAPDTHPDEKVKGKDVEVDIALKDLKRLELVEITPAFLQDLGFETEQELRDALREQMEQKIQDDVQQAMREQVKQHLVANTQLELPAKLSEKQADRVVSRRAVDLMMRGMPREQVEANIERLRGGAAEEGRAGTEALFHPPEAGRQAQPGRGRGRAERPRRHDGDPARRPPEKMKQDMAKDGSLASLYVQMREQKAIDKLLESAQIEEVEVQNASQAGDQGPGQTTDQGTSEKNPNA